MTLNFPHWQGSKWQPRGDLTMYDDLPAAEAVAKAWTVPGPVPGLHEQMRRNIRHDMPLLGRALDRLEKEGK